MAFTRGTIVRPFFWILFEIIGTQLIQFIVTIVLVFIASEYGAIALIHRLNRRWRLEYGTHSEEKCQIFQPSFILPWSLPPGFPTIRCGIPAELIKMKSFRYSYYICV